MRMLKLPRNCQCSRTFSGKSSKKLDISEGMVICFDNPLLDIAKKANNKDLLKKYMLAEDGAVIATVKHIPLFKELSQMKDVVCTAGGSGQNTMRVFQWIIRKPFCGYFVGAIGMDKVGETMYRKALSDGVRTVYQIKHEIPTGTCAVIVTGFSRSLVANLGAAGSFTEDWFNDEVHRCYLTRAKYVYTTGFFMSVNAAVVRKVAEVSLKNNATFLFNLSSVEMLKTQKSELDEIFPHTDFVIGNKEEAMAYADTHDWNTTNIIEIGERIQCEPKHNERPRVVLITDAKWPVLCFKGNGKHMEYPVPKVCKSKIVDTNGCGDAFVGGFLSQLVQKKSLDCSIRMGIFASQQVLYITGIQIDKLPKFTRVSAKIDAC